MTEPPNDARPIDWWMLVIELMVLVLILVEVGWGLVDRCRAWRKRKKYEEDMRNLSTTLRHLPA